MALGRNGGIIGARNVPTVSAASGVWTLNEVRDAVDDGIWPGSGVRTSIHAPDGTTPLLQMSGESDATTFQTNSITGVVNGTLTHNASGGPSGTGYISGWGASDNVGFATQAPYANARSYACWYDGTQSGDNGSAWLPYVALFCGAALKQGINNDSIASSNSSGDMTEGTTSVIDDAWHLLVWTFAGDSSGDITAYIDGNNVESAVTQGPVNSTYNTQIFGDNTGTGTSGTLRHPTAIGGIQIFSDELTGSQIQEIYDAGVTGV